MANQKIERQLEHLAAIRSSGPSEASYQSLRKALADRVNLVVAKAANIAGEWQARALLPNLIETYERLFDRAAETDPQCWAKNEISRCLKEMGVAESAHFLRGVKHHQLENTWGGKTDTAATLRSTCALALVQCTDITRHDILLHLVNALTEEDATVRTDATRAIEQMNGRDSALLLRLKARAGDKESCVTGQVLESLLAVEGASGVPFASQFLHNADHEIREESALALGASRLPEAVDALKQEWLNPLMRMDKTVLLRAISASRQDSALSFLLEQLSNGPVHVAEDSLWALKLHRNSEEIVKRIEAAVSKRPELASLFAEIYPSRRF